MHVDQILGPVDRQSLPQRIAHTIKRYILSEGLNAGDALPSERQLADSLVVSRTVVREALGILVGEGLITKEAGRGIFVQSFDREKINTSYSLVMDGQETHFAELVELRRAIEVGALGLVIQRILPAQIVQLQSLLSQMRDKLELRETIAAEDVAFHCILLEAAGNPFLSQFRFLVEEVMRLSVERDLHAIREEHDERSVVSLAALLEAIRTGDVEAARRHMETHLTPKMNLEKGELA